MFLDFYPDEANAAVGISITHSLQLYTYQSTLVWNHVTQTWPFIVVPSPTKVIGA